MDRGIGGSPGTHIAPTIQAPALAGGTAGDGSGGPGPTGVMVYSKVAGWLVS